MSDGDRVVLRLAYEWDCPLCQASNFAKAVAVSEDEVRKSLDLAPWEAIPDEFEGGCVSAPEAVTCGACGLTFELVEEADERPL